MDENAVKNIAEPKSEAAEDRQEKREEMARRMREELEAAREKNREAQEAMGQGKGRLRLEKPILAGDKEIDELAYDFMALTGMEIVNAKSVDPNAQQIFAISDRQALALFAAAAAKHTEGLDMQDILSRIGPTDAIIGVQLATLFFSASTRAGRLRISKM